MNPICAMCSEIVDIINLDSSFLSTCCGSWSHLKCSQPLESVENIGWKCTACQIKRECESSDVIVESLGEEVSLAIAMVKVEVTCLAEECLCDDGRAYNRDGSPWEIVACNNCHLFSTHLRCSNIEIFNDNWKCTACQQKSVKLEEYLDITHEYSNAISDHRFERMKIETSDDPNNSYSVEFSNDHLTVNDSDKAKKSYKCNNAGCDIAFSSLPALKRHHQTHTRKRLQKRKKAKCYVVQSSSTKTKRQTPTRPKLTKSSNSGSESTISKKISLITNCHNKTVIKRNAYGQLGTHIKNKLNKRNGISSPTALYNKVICKKTTADHVKRHRRFNLCKKSYKCDSDGCSATFSDGASLKAHHHSHTVGKAPECDDASAHVVRKPRVHASDKSLSDYDGYAAAFNEAIGKTVAVIRLVDIIKYPLAQTGEKSLASYLNRRHDSARAAPAGKIIKKGKFHTRNRVQKENLKRSAGITNQLYTHTEGKSQKRQLKKRKEMKQHDGCDASLTRTSCLKAPSCTGKPPLAENDKHDARLKTRKEMGLHKCDYDGCLATFTRAALLKIHRRTHVGKPPFAENDDAELEINKEMRPHKCDYDGCNATFRCTSTLIRHRRRHNGGKPFKCNHDGCDAAFRRAASLKKHQRIHTTQKPYSCDFDNCSSAFSTPSKLLIHHRTHTGETPYKCDHAGCPAAFKRSYDIIRHRRVHTGEKPYKCSYVGCDVTFSHLSSLASHRRMHSGEKPYKCDYEECGAAFSHKTNLRTHRRMHTGEMPFKCSYEGCVASYKYSSSLNKHRFIHTGEKRFKCTYEGCDSAFSQSSALARHSVSHTGEKLFKCDFNGCNALYSRASSLKIHNRVHTGEKPYKCAFDGCDASFDQLRKFATHKISHTGEKHKCDFDGCNAEYTRLATLKSHNRIHTGELPFVCDLVGCSAAFISASLLLEHRRCHENETVVLIP